MSIMSVNEIIIIESGLIFRANQETLSKRVVFAQYDLIQDPLIQDPDAGYKWAIMSVRVTTVELVAAACQSNDRCTLVKGSGSDATVMLLQLFGKLMQIGQGRGIGHRDMNVTPHRMRRRREGLVLV
jgi:hypothetical protein